MEKIGSELFIFTVHPLYTQCNEFRASGSKFHIGDDDE